MGYRHEIVGVIAMPTTDFFVQQIAGIKLSQESEAEDALTFFLENSRIMPLEVIPRPWTEKKEGYYKLPEGCMWYAWEVCEPNTKWWWVEPFWRKIVSNAENCGLNGGFWRVGEETEDVEEDDFCDSDGDNKLETYMRQLGMFSDWADAGSVDRYKSYVDQYMDSMNCVTDPYGIVTYVDRDTSSDQKELTPSEVLNVQL
jgi:hypothetical protein